MPIALARVGRDCAFSPGSGWGSLRSLELTRFACKCEHNTPTTPKVQRGRRQNVEGWPTVQRPPTKAIFGTGQGVLLSLGPKNAAFGPCEQHSPSTAPKFAAGHTSVTTSSWPCNVLPPFGVPLLGGGGCNAVLLNYTVAGTKYWRTVFPCPNTCRPPYQFWGSASVYYQRSAI